MIRLDGVAFKLLDCTLSTSFDPNFDVKLLCIADGGLNPPILDLTGVWSAADPVFAPIAVLGLLSPTVFPFAVYLGVLSKSFCASVSASFPRPPRGLDFKPVYSLDVAPGRFGVELTFEDVAVGYFSPKVFLAGVAGA